MSAAHHLANGKIAAGGQIVLWLSRETGGPAPEAWAVDTFQQLSETCHKELRFPQARACATDLVPTLWGALQDYLPRSTDPHVLTANGFSLVLPAVALARLRVTGHASSGGRQRVMVTFRNVVGVGETLFRDERSPDILHDTRNTLATAALVDLLMPMLALAEGVLPQRDDARERLEARLLKLSEKRSELDFYGTLLTRYIAQSANREQANLNAPTPRDAPRISAASG